MAIHISPLASNDLPIAGTIAQAAYKRSSNYEAMLGRYLALQPDGWYLARLEGEPVGLGGAVDFGPFASLGMMSVLPTMQKRGVGQALMEHILSWLDGRSCPTILLNARPQAIALYERCGFKIMEQTLQIKLAPLSGPPKRTEKIFVATSDLLPALATLDAPAFGATRLTVLRGYFEQAPERFLVSKDTQGQLTGFLVAGKSALGPFYAASSAIAEALVQYALCLPYTVSPIVSFLESNHEASALFARYAREQCEPLAHMLRGQPLQRDAPHRLYAMASLMLC